MLLYVLPLSIVFQNKMQAKQGLLLRWQLKNDLTKKKIKLSILKEEKWKPNEVHHSKWITKVGELGNALQ